MTETDDHSQTDTALARGKKPRPWFKIIVIVVVAVVAVIWFGFWLSHRLSHVSGKDARVMAHEITVSSRLPGRVTRFGLILGDRLQVDDAVAQLYSRPDQLKLAALRARLDGVKSQLATQEARLQLAQKLMAGGIRQTKDLLQADIAAQSAAKADMIMARKNSARSDRLFKSHSVSKRQRDNDHYRYLSARAKYQQAKREVELDRTALANAHNGLLTKPQMTLPNPSVLRGKLAAIKDRLAEVKAELQHQRTRLDDLDIKSPIHGVVDKTFIEQGNYVSAGQPILMMHDPDDVWIEAKIKETKINQLRVGQPVSIRVDARPDRQYRGHVAVIGQAATNQFALLPDPNPSGNFTKITQRLPVRIAIDHGQLNQLSPGMMVEVDINISKGSNANNHATSQASRGR